MRKIMTLLLFTLFSVLASAQTLKVNGVVTDAATGDVLPGVSIIIKGTTTGTETDFDGLYSLANVTKGSVLVFNYLEGKIQTSINADKMNYLSLQMVDNFPHFHVFPRFKSKPQNDEFYPKPVLMNKFSVLDNLETDKILNHLKKL